MVSDHPVVAVVLGCLSVIQTIALAVIADRSRRVRRTDRDPSTYRRRATDT